MQRTLMNITLHSRVRLERVFISMSLKRTNEWKMFAAYAYEQDTSRMDNLLLYNMCHTFPIEKHSFICSVPPLSHYISYTMHPKRMIISEFWCMHTEKICSGSSVCVFALRAICVCLTFRTHFIMNGESAPRHTKQITVMHNLYVLPSVIYYESWHRYNRFHLIEICVCVHEKHLFDSVFFFLICESNHSTKRKIVGKKLFFGVSVTIYMKSAIPK